MPSRSASTVRSMPPRLLKTLRAESTAFEAFAMMDKPLGNYIHTPSILSTTKECVFYCTHSRDHLNNCTVKSMPLFCMSVGCVTNVLVYYRTLIWSLTVRSTILGPECTFYVRQNKIYDL